MGDLQRLPINEVLATLAEIDSHLQWKEEPGQPDPLSKLRSDVRKARLVAELLRSEDGALDRSVVLQMMLRPGLAQLGWDPRLVSESDISGVPDTPPWFAELMEPCPFDPGKLVRDTHVLMSGVKQFHGVMANLWGLRHLADICKVTINEPWYKGNDAIFREALEPEWYLMPLQGCTRSQIPSNYEPANAAETVLMWTVYAKGDWRGEGQLASRRLYLGVKGPSREMRALSLHSVQQWQSQVTEGREASVGWEIDVLRSPTEKVAVKRLPNR